MNSAFHGRDGGKSATQGPDGGVRLLQAEMGELVSSQASEHDAALGLMTVPSGATRLLPKENYKGFRD